MSVAVGPNFVEAVVAMHSNQVIVAAGTAAVAFATADANRVEKVEMETVAVVGYVQVAEQAVGIVVVAVPSPVVVEEIA